MRMYAKAPARRSVGLAVSLLALAATALVSCRGGQSPASNETTDVVSSNDGPVATINGEPISKDQFLHRLEVAGGARALSQLVTEDLWIQLAKKDGVLPTDATIQAKYDKVKEQPGFEAKLRATLQTPDDVKHKLLANLAEQAAITKGISVNDQEIHAFYDLNTDPRNASALFFQPEAVSVQIINTDNKGDIARAKHDIQSGATFEAVARSYSKDKSKSNGGLLPPALRGQIDKKKYPGLEETAFSMKPNQIIYDFHTPGFVDANGRRIAMLYWIIHCVNHRPQRKLPFDQVKEDCRTGAMMVKGNRENPNILKDYIKQADIKALWPQYKDVLSK